MLLLIAAAPFEFAGFSGLIRKDSREVRWLATTVIRRTQVLLVANGTGRRAAAVGARAAIARNRVNAVVSTGFAGALVPELGVGDTFLAETVFDGAMPYRGCEPTVCPPNVRRGSLITVDRVVRSVQAKAELAARGAQAVDMEAGAVAAVAAECQLPYYCVRAISDSATDDLPLDFNRALRSDGTFSPWNIAGQAALRPVAWNGLLRLALDAKRCSAALAGCLTRCEFGC